MDQVIAHKNEKSGHVQTLKDHLLQTAIYSESIGRKIEMPNVTFLIGVMHDIGKASNAFQHKIKNDTNDQLDHSTAGAYYLKELLVGVQPQNKKELILLMQFNEILEYVIEAHHGVFDAVKKDEDSKWCSVIKTRLLRYENNESLEVQQFFEKMKDEYDLNKVYRKAFDEYKRSIRNLLEGNKLKNNSEFYLYRFFYIRLFLSILKSADILDTINATEQIVEKQEITDDIKQEFIDKIEEKANSFGEPTSEINKIRQKISDAAKAAGCEYDTGIYTMDIPVGGGKTISSMRYACHNLMNKKKDRIIYLTSFLSVLEQNAAEIKSIFDVENERYILEHHSNVIEDEEVGDDNELTIKTYLNETWDDYIVLSTTVQFLNTIMKSKSSNLRRFSSLINSVIIIDEVQSLPLKVIYIFNVVMNFLKNVMNANVVLCTATQPPYGLFDIEYKIEYGDFKGNNKDIVTLNEEERKVFERVEFRKINEEDNHVSLEEIAQKIKSVNGKSCLVILNTKKAVWNLYNLLDDEDIYCLTTNLCPYHRRELIEEIKHKLSNNEQVICISTQLIEAGVDVDFDYVIRSYAGIDSIVQASGRCNREGRLDVGYVDLAYLDGITERTKNIKEIHDKKMITEDIIKNQTGSLNIEDLSTKFFEKYFINHKEEMKYLCDKDNPSLVDLITKGIETERRIKLNGAIIKQQFKTISNKFNVIDERTVGVIVPYNEIAIELIEELISAMNNFEYDHREMNKIKWLLKKLQPYTVNMYKTVDNTRMFMEYMEDMSMPVYILADGYYDGSTGVVESSDKVDLIF